MMSPRLRPFHYKRKLPLRRFSVKPLPPSTLYEYLQLEQFSKDEIGARFDEIVQTDTTINTTNLHKYMYAYIIKQEKTNAHLYQSFDDEATETARHDFAKEQVKRILTTFDTLTPNREEFSTTIERKATQVDIQRTWPIIASMLVVGSSVGVTTPCMPFVVEEIGLTASQYGGVVSAFALAKMLGNIPSAIAVERNGRKPYMTKSFFVIALGVGGIGIAQSFEELYLCRLLTGIGVSYLSGAATMMITDLSTPLNRASTMAPILSAFSAGTAIGPAIGGYAVDNIGLHPTFYMVGMSYIGVAALNTLILNETKPKARKYPWQKRVKAPPKDESIVDSVQKAFSQWGPLLGDSKIRRILIMNGMYWIALAGSQMTLLPLILTESTGLAFTATQVGQVYAGMSLVQIFGNPIFAKMIDKLGKAPAIVAGCTLISGSMVTLPYCTDMSQVALNMFIWSTGSSMLSTAPVAYLTDQVDATKRAQAIALLRTCGDVGFLLGATGSGALADWSGSLPVAMHSASGLLLTATAWFATRQLLEARLTSSKQSV